MQNTRSHQHCMNPSLKNNKKTSKLIWRGQAWEVQISHEATHWCLTQCLHWGLEPEGRFCSLFAEASHLVFPLARWRFLSHLRYWEFSGSLCCLVSACRELPDSAGRAVALVGKAAPPVCCLCWKRVEGSISAPPLLPAKCRRADFAAQLPCMLHASVSLLITLPWAKI